MYANSREFAGEEPGPRHTISVPNVARTLVLSLEEMERIALHRPHLLAALFACAAGLSCGAGVHDGDEAQAATSQISAAEGGSINFMGAELDIRPGDLGADATIKLTWHRAIAHVGALSSVYDIEVPGPNPFLQDPRITIWTTEDIVHAEGSVIGLMVPNATDPTWVPETYAPDGQCPDSTVCGPVQSQSFATTNVLRLAIVTQCYREQDTPCPSGQSCARSNACQQCPSGSPCP